MLFGFYGHKVFDRIPKRNWLVFVEINVRWLAWSLIAQASINKNGLEFEIDDVAMD